MDTPEADPVDARIVKLEARVARVEKRLFESQMLVARKLVEIFAALKKHQETRDQQMQQVLAKLLEQVAELKANLDPMVAPLTTH
jgi:hypothetical protein